MRNFCNSCDDRMPNTVHFFYWVVQDGARVGRWPFLATVLPCLTKLKSQPPMKRCLLPKKQSVRLGVNAIIYWFESKTKKFIIAGWRHKVAALVLLPRPPRFLLAHLPSFAYLALMRSQSIPLRVSRQRWTMQVNFVYHCCEEFTRIL